jgi:uncharacterized membrane protein HdeD (DUF308 family)
MGDAYMGVEVPDASSLDHRSSWAAHNWRWVLAFGIAAIAFGAALISSAFASLSVLAWLAGLFLVFAGVAELIVPLSSDERRRQLTGAAIAIVGGLILLAWPGETLTVLAFVVGIAFTAWGLVSIVTALQGPSEGRRWGMVVGAGSAALGILMMAWPTQTVAVVGVLVGLVAVVWGVMTVLHALDFRREGSRWEETQRVKREHIDQAWREFERSEETREARGVERPGEAEPSSALESPDSRRAA